MKATLPVWADLSPVKITEGPGEPVRIRVSSSLGRMPPPDFNHVEISPDKGFFQLLGVLSLVMEPHLGGYRWWLCGSWMLDQSTTHDWSSHESALRETEPTGSEIFELPCLKLSSRWAVSRIQFLDFRVQHSHMKKLTEIMGDPHKEGQTFFNRLLPGRIPAAIRCTPQQWQIWLQL